MAYNETPTTIGIEMLTLNEIINMSPEEFAKNWNNNNIQDASLKLLGAREMTEDDKKHLEENE